MLCCPPPHPKLNGSILKCSPCKVCVFSKALFLICFVLKTSALMSGDPLVPLLLNYDLLTTALCIWGCIALGLTISDLGRMLVPGLLHEPSGIPKDNISKSLPENKSLGLK